MPRYLGKNFELNLWIEAGRSVWLLEWETRKLAYSDFKPIFRGRDVQGNPELNSDALFEIGFMIRDGQEGAFELSVRRLAVYRNSDASR